MELKTTRRVQRNHFPKSVINKGNKASTVPLPHIKVSNDGSTLDFDRVVVYIRRNSKNPYKLASFSTCLFDLFHIDIDIHVMVECFIKKNKVYIQLPEPSNNKTKKRRKVYRLEHPVYCAVHRLTESGRQNLPLEITSRGIDVGVSVILQSADEKVLVTRRAYHMRTFPGVWVSPGGHIEEGETFAEAGLREVHEETGLKLENVDCRVLGLWESVFPAVLYEGEPRRHHLVVYLNVILEQEAEELQNSVKLDPVEVSASMWISKQLAAIVVGGGVPGFQIKRLHIPITVVNTDGSQSEGELDPKVLRKKMPAPDRIVERLTTGTRYALKQWLYQMKTKNTNKSRPASH